jgi:hypothetical protein
MRSFRPYLFRVRPAGQNLIREVVLYEDTWHGHIVARHPELAGMEAQVEQVASTPTAIHASTSRAGSFLFVKAGIVDSSGRSLRVAVRADGEISTAVFSSASGGSQVWP